MSNQRLLLAILALVTVCRIIIKPSVQFSKNSNSLQSSSLPARNLMRAHIIFISSGVSGGKIKVQLGFSPKIMTDSLQILSLIALVGRPQW